jgi:hypothetical protein
MSDGYNTLFNPYRGSLYGRFPSGPVFVSVFLALMDRQGYVDYSVDALAGMTGWPIDWLRQAIHDLMQPDPHSRSKELDGRRIVPIENNRPWGWRVVNAAAYRDKARLMAKAARERDEGMNAKRMANRRRPPETAGDRPSDSYSNTNTKKNPPLSPPSGGVEHVFGLNLHAWQRFAEYRREIRKPIKAGSIAAAQKKLAAFGADQAGVVEESIAQGWTGLFALRDSKEKKVKWKPPTDDGDA